MEEKIPTSGYFSDKMKKIRLKARGFGWKEVGLGLQIPRIIVSNYKFDPAGG